MNVMSPNELRTHLGICEIDRRLILAREAHEFCIEMGRYSCDEAEGGASSSMILSAADPEPAASSFSELSAKVIAASGLTFSQQ